MQSDIDVERTQKDSRVCFIPHHWDRTVGEGSNRPCWLGSPSSQRTYPLTGSRVEDEEDEGTERRYWGEGRVIAVSTQLRLHCSEEKPKKLSLPPLSPSDVYPVSLRLSLVRFVRLRFRPSTQTPSTENFAISLSGEIIYSTPPTRLPWESVLHPSSGPSSTIFRRRCRCDRNKRAWNSSTRREN